jgi:hypothetical protein
VVAEIKNQGQKGTSRQLRAEQLMREEQLLRGRLARASGLSSSFCPAAFSQILLLTFLNL